MISCDMSLCCDWCTSSCLDQGCKATLISGCEKDMVLNERWRSYSAPPLTRAEGRTPILDVLDKSAFLDEPCPSQHIAMRTQTKLSSVAGALWVRTVQFNCMARKEWWFMDNGASRGWVQSAFIPKLCVFYCNWLCEWSRHVDINSGRLGVIGILTCAFAWDEVLAAATRGSTFFCEVSFGGEHGHKRH